jgi:anti-sigma regulatory factor (Ser/Thr protein kinase)
MRISVPNVFDTSSMYEVLNKIVDKSGKAIVNDITFDLEDLFWVRPTGITVMGSLLSWLQNQQIKFSFEGYNKKNSAAIEYFDENDIFARFLGRHRDNRAKTKRNSLIPLRVIDSDTSYDWLMTEFSPWLKSKLKMTNPEISSIVMSFLEIFNNILDHSGETVGCFSAQHYPKKDTVSISISDFGVGIPNRIRSVQPALDDESAIEFAAQEGNTSKTHPRNRGAGINTMIHNIIVHNHGKLTIYSGNGILKCSQIDSKLHLQKLRADGFYPGTLFEIEMRTDTISEALKEEAYEW